MGCKFRFLLITFHTFVLFVCAIAMPKQVSPNQAVSLCITTLQYLTNTKVSQHRFSLCYENGLIKMIQTIPHNLYLSVKLTFFYCGLRLILVYPNPQ